MSGEKITFGEAIEIPKYFLGKPFDGIFGLNIGALEREVSNPMAELVKRGVLGHDGFGIDAREAVRYGEWIGGWEFTVGAAFWDWGGGGRKGKMAHYWVDLASKDFWAIWLQDVEFGEKGWRREQPILTLVDSNTDGVLMSHELITRLGLNKSYECDKLDSE